MNTIKKNFLLSVIVSLLGISSSFSNPLLENNITIYKIKNGEVIKKWHSNTSFTFQVKDKDNDKVTMKINCFIKDGSCCIEDSRCLIEDSRLFVAMESESTQSNKSNPTILGFIKSKELLNWSLDEEDNIEYCVEYFKYNTQMYS